MHEIGDEPADRPVGRWTRFCIRADFWPILLLALALMCGYFWGYSSPTVAMALGTYNYYGFCLGAILFGLLAVFRRKQLALQSSYKDRFGVQTKESHSQRRFWLWFIVIVFGSIMMIWSEFPMRISFALSRSAFDDIADEALKDPKNAHLLAGHWTGLYRIEGVEVIGKTVVLYFDNNKDEYGFARVPNAASEIIFNISFLEHNPHYHEDFPKQEGGSTPEGKRIKGDWFVMYSMYWRSKDGWS